MQNVRPENWEPYLRMLVKNIEDAIQQIDSGTHPQYDANAKAAIDEALSFIVRTRKDQRALDPHYPTPKLPIKGFRWGLVSGHATVADLRNFRRFVETAARKNPARAVSAHGGNPAKYVYVLTILNSPHRGEAAGRREIGEYGAHRGIYWTEAAANKALRKLLKQEGVETRHYKTRVEKRPATAFERLGRVRDVATITYPRNATWEQARQLQAKRGRFTVYLSVPGASGEVLARFPTRKRADVFAKHAESAYGKGTVWVEAPGSVESKLRRMSEEDA